MIDNIKNAIYQSLSELFADAAVDKMAGDSRAYKEKLKTVAQIAEILGIDTEVITVAINIKTGKVIIDVEVPGSADDEPGTDIALK